MRVRLDDIADEARICESGPVACRGSNERSEFDFGGFTMTVQRPRGMDDTKQVSIRPRHREANVCAVTADRRLFAIDSAPAVDLILSKLGAHPDWLGIRP